MDRACPGAIVLIAPLEHRQVQMFLDQFVQGAFECAWFELILKGNGHKNHLIVLVWFVSGHSLLLTAFRDLIFPLFRQLQRLALAAWGGRVDSLSKRKNSKPRKMPENAARTPSRLHAVLGSMTPDLLSLFGNRATIDITTRRLTISINQCSIIRITGLKIKINFFGWLICLQVNTAVVPCRIFDWKHIA